jgi:peptidoglycan/LPS O-acetylase OafA/YrhL
LKELNGLTGLRFLAAFYVFVFHMQMQFGLSFLPVPLANIIGQGALGVNAFFVLSGFILTYNYTGYFTEDKAHSWQQYRRFVSRRFFRIYPVYLVGLLLSVLVSYVFRSYPSSFPVLLLLNALMLESYLPSLSMEWYGGGAWSISTEFFFYLLFPLILSHLVRSKRKEYLLILLALVLVVSSLPGAYFTLHQASRFELAYSFPPSRLAEFVCGMLLGLLMLRHSFRISEGLLLILLLLTSIYLATFGPYVSGFTVHNAVVIPTIMAMICVLSKSENTRFFKWVGSRCMIYLGRISYSFYIVQIPLMSIVDCLMAKHIVHRGDNILVLLMLISNLVLAAILFEVVEKKLHHSLLNRWFDNE